MKNMKFWRTALVAALVLTVMLSVTGGTIAWFTDTVTSGENIIASGTLDAEMYWADGTEAVPADGSASWKDASDANTKIFDYDKWEPGYVQVRHIKIANVGNLAFKYQLSIEANGQVSELADVIDVYFVDPATQVASREDLNAVEPRGTLSEVLAGMPVNTMGDLGAGASNTVTIALKMQESAGNEYQGKSIGSDFSVKLYATQDTVEADSFDDQYDAETPFVTGIIEVTPEDAQSVLNGAQGKLHNKKIVLTAGEYGLLKLGVASDDDGSDTVYTCPTHDKSFDSAEAYKVHLQETGYHAPGYFDTTLKNVVISAEDGVTVEGLLITSGHNYNNPENEVLGDNTQYYQINHISNITFENINFTAKVDINSSLDKTVIDGVTFRNCTFTTGGIEAANGAGLRFYNESATNGQVRNLVVKNCSFNNLYQGVYTQNVNGITVMDSSFDTTGHNAVAVQSHNVPVNHKAVVIKGNTFANIHDRIIRFGYVGADTQITIQNNTATNSGDEDEQIIKAVSLADGVTYAISNNSWGEGKDVGDVEFADQTTTN